ncbi:MAG: exonuclease domain-containing protein, partial [Chloroflexota bacterium]|nr:exonuclease domain-containing protein [Chloroflexota bacterium]
TTTGPHPPRARILRVAALAVDGASGEVRGRYSATVNPGRHIPNYVARRAGFGPEILDALRPIGDVLDALLEFLEDRPIVAQEAHAAWAFVLAEARRLGRALADPTLVNLEELADRVLAPRTKPTLAVLARRFDLGFTRIENADEQARLIGLLVPRLLQHAQSGLRASLAAPRQLQAPRPLRQARTARDMPETPGIYVMRDAADAALYVGKARRLRQRLAAYVHRPLGATRRLEGLAEAVERVESLPCATDLEALILEDREIRRLQPRFNTVRRQRAPRTWLRLPPQPTPRPGRRQPTPARLELSGAPGALAGDYCGPFRNEAAAEHARSLVRDVFDLDRLRGQDRQAYVERLNHAWSFLHGSQLKPDLALDLARQRHAQAVASGDVRRARHWHQRIGQVRSYAPATALLPADPCQARYAVVRPADPGIEGFVLDRGIVLGWSIGQDPRLVANDLLGQSAPRTTPEDLNIVLRWFGAQGSRARLVLLPDDTGAAEQTIATAAAELLGET